MIHEHDQDHLKMSSGRKTSASGFGGQLLVNTDKVVKDS
jgi:hypothetical protein